MKFSQPVMIGFILWAISSSFSACNGDLQSTPTDSPAPTAPSKTQAFTSPITLPTTTPTEIPLIAVVNDEDIYLSDYITEVFLLQMVLSDSEEEYSFEEIEERALDNLINQVLLSQAAAEAGFIITKKVLEVHIEDLANQIGGYEALADWQAQHSFDEEGFLRALSRSIAAAWQRDQIVTNIPTKAEQVLAQQILVFDSSTADLIYQQLQSGADFASIAFQYDPITGGTLGWFPRNYLTLPELEASAFVLEPGQFSDVISTSYGFHIILVLDREAQRQLSPDALRVFQHNALENWLTDRKEQSEITITFP